MIKPYPGDARYRISDTGDVWGPSGKKLKPWLSDGYLKVFIGAKNARYIHQLVLETFEGPRPDGHVSRHGPGGQLDNSIENLSYGTQSQNCRDTVAQGRNHNASKVKCIRGHRLSGSNLKVETSGRRLCRKCKRDKENERRAARRAA